MAALVVAAAIAGCTQTFRNNASTPMHLCLRHNADPPGLAQNKTLAPGEVWQQPCPVSGHGTSHIWYFALRDHADCGWDHGCMPDTGTCRSYPWVFAQGTSSDDGLWYGDIAANWDGGGLGFTGDYGKSNAMFGLRFRCNGYNDTQHHDLRCGVTAGNATCNPDHPNLGGKPASGVVECDPIRPVLEIFDA